MAIPNSNDYAPYYQSYVKLVQEDDLLNALKSSLTEIRDQLNLLTPDKADHRYAEDKWTIKELLQHMIDTERVFSYRAVAIARGEQQDLPGFDENAYARTADVSNRNLSEMKEELIALRQSVYYMFKGLTDADLARKGTANKNEVTVNALGYIIIGHLRHHLNIIRERYL